MWYFWDSLKFFIQFQNNKYGQDQYTLGKTIKKIIDSQVKTARLTYFLTKNMDNWCF